MKRIWVPLFLASLLAAQHDAGKDTKRNPAMGNPDAIAAGKALFAGSCAVCHGADGQGGRGPNLRQRGAWHPLDDDALFKVIQKGIPGTEMPATNVSEAQQWQIASFVRSLTAPAYEMPPPGDLAAGEAIFKGKGGCVNCHQILGRGGMLGPDLTNVGGTRSLEDLKESVLDPDADGFPRHKAVTLTLKSGATIKGVARNRTNYSIQVQEATGKLHLLQMADVKDLSISPHSPMPRDYKQRLTIQEFDNLIAFLSRLSARPYEAPEKK